MLLSWRLAAFIVWQRLSNGAAAAPEGTTTSGGFVQESSEPNAQRGSGGSPSLDISWDATGDRTIPRILGYELQYAVAGRGETSDEAAWYSVDGHQKDTWDVTVRVDGFDRFTKSNHTVGDGWFTLSLSRVYPKPSPLPDLLVVTDAIAWDDTWEELETKAQRALRESGHRQYSHWLVEVVRCDETEQREDNHWAGGCPFLEYGGYTWHLRFSPPADVLADPEEYPLVHVVKETITGKWSGDGHQVIASRYGQFSAMETENGGLAASSSGLVDPFFCQRGRCTERLEGLREATPYAVRLRAYNRNGFGPWKASTTDASLWPADPMSTATTAGAPALPQLKAPRLSSSTSTTLTVFVDGKSDTGDIIVLEGYEFDIQPYDQSDEGDTSQWTSVMGEADHVGPRGIVVATGLSPSSQYRFRVRATHGEQRSPASAISEVFTTGPGLPSRAPSPPTLEGKSVTSDEMAVTWPSWAAEGDEDSDRGGEYKFEAQSQQLGSGYWREAVVTLTRDGEWRASAGGLAAYSQYTFRVRAVNDIGAGEWSAEASWARTDADISYDPLIDEDIISDIPASVLLSVSGDGELPGNFADFDYYHGVGRGGRVNLYGNGGEGSAGAAVIIASVPGTPLPSQAVLFFTGASEAYTVPSHSGVTSITLKLWGAGGGGALTPGAAIGADNETASSNVTQVLGGGGGFLQAKVLVSPGETLQVLVGGGGAASHGEVGGAGGFNGGRNGGSGGSAAGGGGGSTSVLRHTGVLIAAAGGGGGGGNAENCCAHGGAGGGESGGHGGSPGLGLAAVGTWGSQTCDGGWCSGDSSQGGTISYEGMEKWITTGGGGGTTTQGGASGNSDVFDWVEGGGGRQGGIASPRGGETSIPVVFRGTSSRPATPGQSLDGGIGADDARGGGGGGGGFYGGGGGGSGQQGAGGGGGSSYADISALCTAAVDESASGWANGVGKLRVVEAGESWVEVEWDKVSDAAVREEPAWYEVEISTGRGSDDFYLAAKVDGYNPLVALPTTSSLAAGSTYSTVFKTELQGLSPSTDYSVRVSAATRSGLGRPSEALGFSTAALPTNRWERVIPRSSRLERGGGGLSGPVLGRPHLGDTDLASHQKLWWLRKDLDSSRYFRTVATSLGDFPLAVVEDYSLSRSSKLTVSGVSYNSPWSHPTAAAGAFSDPPTALRQALPSARSGHSLAVVAGKVYMFGGFSSSRRCSSAVVGSTALGGTQGGAGLEDCIGGSTLSAELWQLDPASSLWTEIVVSSNAPSAREGHTASVIGSNMIVFGGRGVNSTANSTAGQGGSVLLGDQWEIDLDPSHTVSVQTNASTVIPEGSPIFIPLTVDQSSDEQDEQEMCVAGLTVNVEIYHGCIDQLHLTLYGPGPHTRGADMLENTARAEPAVLFTGCDGTSGGCTLGSSGSSLDGGCTDGLRASFSDSSESGVLQCCGEESPSRGSFKPADRFLVGRFLQMPAKGEWALRVIDGVPDGTNGTVREWSLDVEMKPCNWQSALRWSNTTSEDYAQPPPRSRHTTAVVDGALYVSGGTGTSGALLDLWRSSNISSTTQSGWALLAEGPDVPLSSSVGPMKPYAASMLLSPWGLLSVGGMVQGKGVGAVPDVWAIDPVSKRWRGVPIEGGVTSPPAGRYHSAVTFVLGATRHNDGVERNGWLLMFGGQDDWRRLDDLWWLHLSSVQVSTSDSQPPSVQQRNQTRGSSSGSPRPHAIGSWSLAEAIRDERCAHVSVSGTTNDTWHGSCGAGAALGGDGSCTMRKVLDMGWCLGDYQGVGSP